MRQQGMKTRDLKIRIKFSVVQHQHKSRVYQEKMVKVPEAYLLI